MKWESGNFSRVSLHPLPLFASRRGRAIIARRATPVFHRSGGFTLLEVLMAIVLLALLLAGAYSGIQTSVRAMHAGERLIERIDRLRTVQEFLRHQLSRILPLPYEQNTNGAYVFEGDRSSMRFVAPMPGYLSRGGPYVQTLALLPGDGGLRLVFSGAMLNGYDVNEEKTAERDPVVLIDHIRDGAFAYRKLDDQGQLAPWSDSWDDASVTPLMIEIQLVMQNGERIDWPTLDVPLMLDAGAARAQPTIIPRLLPGLGAGNQPNGASK
jgi:general secretion pathway protein J